MFAVYPRILAAIDNSNFLLACVGPQCCGLAGGLLG
jgi:hypothetical protein